MPAQRTNEYKFRATNILLTYAQASPITLDELYDFLKNHDYHGRAVKALLVAQEDHQNGGYHFHCYIKLSDRFETRSVRFFDFRGKHPNIEPVRSPKACEKYVTKDGNYKAEINGPNGWEDWVIKVKYTWADVHEATTREEMWETVVRADPRAAIINRSPIKRYAEEKFGSRSNGYESRYTRDNFNETEGMTEWVREWLRFVTLTRNSFWPWI